jgi:erythromycin esterase-like protein
MSQATAPNDFDDAAQNERERIVAWRREELRRAGYSPEAAIVLAANADVDLHLAIDLRARGCPHETALRILA